MLVFGCSRCEILFWKIPLFGNFVVVFLTHGVSCAEVESDWAGISWLEEAPGLFCQTPNTETTKNIPRNIIKQKQCFIFLRHLHQKKKVILAVPRKQLSMWETQNFPHFFVFCLGGRLNICCWVHPLKWLIISVEPLLNTVQFGELGSSS